LQPLKFYKKNQKYFKASSKILEAMWQARSGGALSKFLAGFSEKLGNLLLLVKSLPELFLVHLFLDCTFLI
jgi:hypothetical protein